jgi:hypothetical protein
MRSKRAGSRAKQDEEADQMRLIVLRRRGKKAGSVYIYSPRSVQTPLSISLRLRPCVKEGGRDDCTRDTVSR